jgi:hypothetical protein
MTNRLKKFFTEIRPNLLYDVSKYVAFAVVSLVVAAAAFLYRFLSVTQEISF